MEESQRETMFNAWYNSRIHLTTTIVRTDEKATVSVVYEGKEYSETCELKDCVGSAKPDRIAFMMLQSTMYKVNELIELKYVKYGNDI